MLLLRIICFIWFKKQYICICSHQISQNCTKSLKPEPYIMSPHRNPKLGVADARNPKFQT